MAAPVLLLPMAVPVYWLLLQGAFTPLVLSAMVEGTGGLMSPAND